MKHIADTPTERIGVSKRHLWTIQEPDRSRIERGLAWAANTPARETDIESLLKRRARRLAAARGKRR